MKNIFFGGLVFLFMLLFHVVPGLLTHSNLENQNNQAQPLPLSSIAQPGDILVTKDSNSYGFGHSGIVANSPEGLVIVETKGSEPGIISIDSWELRYKHIKVVRSNSEKKAQKAAEFAEETFAGGEFAYFPIGTPEILYQGKITNCSALVWQSYYFGANENFDNERWWSKSIYPFDFIDPELQSKNGFTTAYTFGNW